MPYSSGTLKKDNSACQHLPEGLDPSKPSSYIMYWDANNLYGGAMSEPLAVGNFKFLSPEEISDFKLEDIPADSHTGFIIECNLHYPHKITR